ncbi:SDR family NAD(P)-dependent oxidoreductase [Hwanghaeella grinnelliae]|uniref:SDR family NAD(P)-dependent oxidoreductase n=1 Tax=Hwanghaeella grinnelliae TaxID=2500179 RepID=A0A3S2VS41_9PROT|nr:SDR family NAD(P)-dependent oxidoreductase [Hwanghaeella grinnelliae]RVU38445.1 SDR family NAD(P)-dependent oxidoreductase [Hwanghaeella grinnelliae]
MTKTEASSHPAVAAGKTAVVTGAASGIGLAACRTFAGLGMNVVMADLTAEDLADASETVAAEAAGTVHPVVADVADYKQIEAIRDWALTRFGAVDLLMNNAVTRVGGGIDGTAEDWHRAMAVNFWGVEGGVRAFLPTMLEQNAPAAIVNVGSKQGITNPPGNLAYNVTKSAVKTYTEGLQHDLRNRSGCKVSAHLLIPGWTTTGKREHKPGAWMPQQVIDFMLAGLASGDFYILCPDDETTAEMDNARILWAARDITENRPPLSRWDPNWKAKFEGER